MEYCPHCMAPNVSGERCPKCGGDLTWKGEEGLDLPVGTVLTGGNGLRVYWLGAALGRGGFGITYAAIDTISHRKVAIKEYFPSRVAYRTGGVVKTYTSQGETFQTGLDNFLKEARMLLAQEDLPSVVRVIDFFQANGTAYLVMEFLDGLPLHSYMKKIGGTIPAQELLQKLEPVIRDLGTLHQRGILHRDISPDNLMWMPNGTIKVMDFGSARSTEGNKTLTIFLKEGFSPIEQYRSSGQGPYTDLYALSATIYFCVTGAVPQGAMDRMESDTLRAPTDLGASLTDAQESAILWGLSVQPQARPQSMEEFHRALYAAPAPAPKPVAPEPIPPTVPKPARKPAQSKPTPPTEPKPAQPAEPKPTPASPKPAPTPTPKVQAPPSQPSKDVSQSSSSTGQRSSRESSRSSASKKPPLFIPLIAVFAAIAIVIGVAVFGGSGKDPETLESTPAATQAPSGEPTMMPSSGDSNTTADGFVYEIVDGDHAVLTGYTKDAVSGAMPSTIDGVPVTEIADGAFAGAPFMMANLPAFLEHMGSKVFQGCEDLRYVMAYSDFSMETDSFAQCGLQDVILSPDATALKWFGEYRFIPHGLKTNVGSIERFTFTSNALYGATDQGAGVLLDVDAVVQYTLLETITGINGEDVPVTWIDSGALERIEPETILALPDSCLFAPSLYDKAQWSAKEDTLADMWLYNNELAVRVNEARSGSAPVMVPDIDAMLAAQDRVKELSELNDWTRPDGSEGYSALQDHGISYTVATQAKGYGSPRSEKRFDYAVEAYSVPISEEASAAHAGEYFTRLGAAFTIAIDSSTGDLTHSYYFFAYIPK